MILGISKFFVYAALASPLLINKSLFFPFITGKVLFFRTTIEFALLLFLILLIFFGWKNNWKEKILQPLFLSVIIFTILFVLTSLTALSPQAAFWSNFERAEGAWQIIHYFIFFALATLLFETKGEWKNIIKWQVIISSLVAIYGLAQIFGLKNGFFISPGTISGTLGNSSYLSIFMVFGLFFITWLFREEKSKLIKILLASLFALHLFMLFQAETRATFLAIAIGILSSMFLLIWQLHKYHKHKFSQKTLALCYLGTFILTATIIFGAAFLVLNLKGNAYESLQPRFWTWGSAFAGFLERPLLGWGVENFPYVFDKYYNAKHFGIESWFDRTHNIFLEYLIGGGITLLLAYLSIFYFLFRDIIKLRKGSNWFWPILLGIPIMYLVNGLTLFEVLPIYLNLFLFLAFFINYKSGFEPLIGNNQVNISSQIKWIGAYCLIVLTGLSIYFTAYLPLRKNMLLIEALRVNEKTPQQVFQNFETALQFYSPVGQSELDQNLFTFSGDFFNWMKEKNIVGPEQKKNIEAVTQLILDWFEKDKSQYVGVKNSFVLLGALIEGSKLTNNKSALQKAKGLLAEEIKLAPTRIELLLEQLKIAEIEKDENAIQQIKNLIKKIRPDLKV